MQSGSGWRRCINMYMHAAKDAGEGCWREGRCSSKYHLSKVSWRPDRTTVLVGLLQARERWWTVVEGWVVGVEARRARLCC